MDEVTSMRDADADVIVVGGGIIGASIAFALTRRGLRDVRVFERDTVGSAGTGKSSGVVRCHYGVPSLAAMAWKSLLLFENAVEILGEEVGFEQTGYLVCVGPGNVGALQANLAMQRSLGIEADQISLADAAALWPAAYLEDFAAFGYEPRGGYGDAYRTAQAFAAAARRGGAVIEQRSPVVELLVHNGRACGVRLADGRQISAPTVVVAAGPWSVGLLAPHGVTLPIRAQREPVLMVHPGRALGRVPVLSDLVSLQYVRAERSGELLVGNSDHRDPEWADPDGYRDSADETFLERAADKLTHRFPALTGARVSTSYSGCYDVTPDYNPVIGFSPVPGVLVAAGFSGHGFKISPAVGELVADLLCVGISSDPDIPAQDFRFGRFADNDWLSSRNTYTGAGEMR